MSDTALSLAYHGGYHPSTQWPLHEIQAQLDRLPTHSKWSENLLTIIASAPEMSSIRLEFYTTHDITPAGIRSVRPVPDESRSTGGQFVWLVIMECPALTVVPWSPSTRGEPLISRSFLSEYRDAGVEVVIKPD